MKKLIFLFNCFTIATCNSADFFKCELNSDCVLVKDGYCSRVIAVNKMQMKNWKVFDQNKTQLALDAKQSCTPLPFEEKIKDFKAVCLIKNCTAKSFN